jgi:DNA (cytosine-5)-methyltransferase 1
MSGLRYLSVCSGIEAASVAWHGLGWTPVGFSEIEPFPSAVLQHHYPHVPNLGDMTNFKEWNLGTVDLLVGGTPCQSFSVAGLRKGLDDPRGNLMLTFVEIAQRYRPRWVVWENVPGVLSLDGGRAFGTLLGALAELGYGWAYRVLDAQWFGVAQRRRRVFVVGCLGDQASAAAVLFESESVQRNPAPSREARQGAAAGVGGGTYLGNAEGGALDAPYLTCSNIDSHVNNQTPLVAQQVKCATGDITHALTTRSAAEEDGTGRGTPLVPTMFSIMPMNSGKDYKAREVQVAQPLMAGGPVGGNQGGDFVAHPVAFHPTQDPISSEDGTTHAMGCGSKGGAATVAGSHWDSPANPHPTLNQSHNTGGIAASDQELFSQRGSGLVAQPVAYGIDGEQNCSEELIGTLRSHQSGGYEGARVAQPVATAMQVRRLTPVECERLQGFPDGYTNIPWRKKPEAPDGPRYKALGNSMAVPCMQWIGERIAKCDSAITKK